MTPDTTGTLRIDVGVGDTISVDGRVLVRLEEKTGQRARLVFKAPKDVPICKLDPLRTRAADLAAMGTGAGPRR